MRPKKSFSQNFLQDQAALSFIAKRLQPGETALEIGGGTGRLTSRLLARNPKMLYVVELEDGAFERLSERFSGLLNIKLLHGDFLKLAPFPIDRIFGNVPYGISSDILFRVRDWGFKSAVLMFQKEFAEKMAAKPGASNYGRLSVTSQLSFNVKLIKTVSRNCFFPVPKVDSAVVEIEKTGFVPTKAQDGMIRRMFSLKNKKIRNSLGKSIDETEFANKRPRELSIDEIRRIFKLGL
jgi:16S rRNA (adenine1518-N6/adenine1519-N6)-dimethyltransferase